MAQPTSSFLQNVNTESSKATYSAVVANYTPAATATDMVVLTGAAGKTVTLTTVRVNGAATVSTFADVYLYKRTTLDTGGTSTSTAIGQHDSQDPAPSCVVKQYSANPSSLGTGVALRSEHISFSAAASGNLVTDWVFAARGAKAPKLNSATESFALNFNGNAVPGGANLHMTIEWTEE